MSLRGLLDAATGLTVSAYNATTGAATSALSAAASVVPGGTAQPPKPLLEIAEHLPESKVIERNVSVMLTDKISSQAITEYIANLKKDIARSIDSKSESIPKLDELCIKKKTSKAFNIAQRASSPELARKLKIYIYLSSIELLAKRKSYKDLYIGFLQKKNDSIPPLFYETILGSCEQFMHALSSVNVEQPSQPPLTPQRKITKVFFNLSGTTIGDVLGRKMWEFYSSAVGFLQTKEAIREKISALRLVYLQSAQVDSYPDISPLVASIEAETFATKRLVQLCLVLAQKLAQFYTAIQSSTHPDLANYVDEVESWKDKVAHINIKKTIIHSDQKDIKEVEDVIKDSKDIEVNIAVLQLKVVGLTQVLIDHRNEQERLRDEQYQKREAARLKAEQDEREARAAIHNRLAIPSAPAGGVSASTAAAQPQIATGDVAINAEAKHVASVVVPPPKPAEPLPLPTAALPRGQALQQQGDGNNVTVPAGATPRKSIDANAAVVPLARTLSVVVEQKTVLANGPQPSPSPPPPPIQSLSVAQPAAPSVDATTPAFTKQAKLSVAAGVLLTGAGIAFLATVVLVPLGVVCLALGGTLIGGGVQALEQARRDRLPPAAELPNHPGKNKSTAKIVFGVLSIIAGIILSFTGVGAIVGGPLIAVGCMVTTSGVMNRLGDLRRYSQVVRKELKTNGAEHLGNNLSDAQADTLGTHPGLLNLVRKQKQVTQIDSQLGDVILPQADGSQSEYRMAKDGSFFRMQPNGVRDVKAVRTVVSPEVVKQALRV